jgi:hypothetical protein
MLGPWPATVDTPEEALRRARIIWAIVLIGQSVFVGVVGFLIVKGILGLEPGDLSRLLTRIGFGLLIVFVPLAYLVRRLMFRRGGEGRPTPPMSYLNGTIVFLSMCEFVSLFGLVVTILNGSFFPPVVATLVAMAVQALNFPDGQEMRPPGPAGAPIEPS